MSKKITTEVFVERARQIHGKKYSYSRASYVSAKASIIVTCPKEGHGDWLTTASNHLHKTHPRGCPSCGGSLALTFETFLVKAKKIHGDSFEYPMQEIKNAKTKITVICKRYGHVRRQTPDSHLSGAGCKACADLESSRRQLVSEKKLNKRLQLRCKGSGTTVKLKSGTYKGMNKVAVIECSKHGSQAPRQVSSMLCGVHPCLDCAQTGHFAGYNSASAKLAIERRFQSKYHIEDFDYVGKKTPVTLICEKHGRWTIQFASCLRSRGCVKCFERENREAQSRALQRKGIETRAKRFSTWLRACKDFHGDKYDYSEVVYLDQKTKVQIGCPYHGYIWQTPDTHKRAGCRYCANDDLGGLYSERYFEIYPERKSWRAILYYLKFNFGNHKWYKVGVTTSELSKRFGTALGSGVAYEILHLKETDLLSAWKAEVVIQSGHGDNYRDSEMLKLLDASSLRLGHSECFSKELPPRMIKEIFH